jgi:proteasome lid subunit RPN8/RPN11
MKTKPLSISKPLWDSLLADLRGRGHGEHESGAFMFAKAGTREVVSYICYDDLDSEAFATGIITFHACGFVKLWDHCERHGFMVVADVHTHPTDWTGQSESDRTHPMVAIKGHVALILPDYAAPNSMPRNGASVYEYNGGHKWRVRTLDASFFQITGL